MTCDYHYFDGFDHFIGELYLLHGVEDEVWVGNAYRCRSCGEKYFEFHCNNCEMIEEECECDGE